MCIESCVCLWSYQDKIRDKVRPIAVEVKYTLTKPTRQHIADPEELEPVLEEYTSKSVTTQVNRQTT